MHAEQLTQLLNKEKLRDQSEQNLTDLMLSHYSKVADVLKEPGKGLKEAHWAMDWREVEDTKHEKVYVIAGLLPATNTQNNEIEGMRATPVVFCIPKKDLTTEEQEYFDHDKDNIGYQKQRESVVQKLVKDREVRKIYNMHGWGADPYVSALPMIEVSTELGGVSVLLGMMGSMGTTNQDQSPGDFVKKSGYDWDKIREQAIGAMYYLEGSEAFGSSNYPTTKIVRIIFGHSMQGKTTLRMLLDNHTILPNTFFVPMTPVLVGGSKEALSLAHAMDYMQGTGRHVHLGHTPAGALMQLELKTIARWLEPAKRTEILLQPLILHFVKLIMKSYLGKSESWGENIIFYAHMLEYIGNPHAILLATDNLEESKPTVSQKTMATAAKFINRFMLVCASEDRVLSSRQLKALAKAISMELNVPVYEHKGKLVINIEGMEWVVPVFEDNHYLKEDSWKSKEGGVIAMVKDRVKWESLSE